MLGAASFGDLELAAPPTGPVQRTFVPGQTQALSAARAITPGTAFKGTQAGVARLVRGVKVSPARQSQAQTVALSGVHVRAAGYTTTVLATAGLVSYWKLGERSGTVMSDWKGSNDGALIGAASTLGVAGLLTNDTDTAVRFAGTAGSYIDSGDAANLQLANGSIEGWVQINNGTSAGAGLFGKLNAYALWCAGADGRLAGLGGNAAPGYLNNGTGAGPVINDGQRHYVAMTFQGGVANGTVLYVDGVAIITGTVAAPSSQASDFTIGELGALYVTGVVDEVAVYNTVLTPAQIAQHYSDGIGAIGETRTQAQSLTRTTAHVRSATFTRTQAGAIAVQRAAARTRALTQSQQFASSAQSAEMDATQTQSTTRAAAVSRSRALTQAQTLTRAGAVSRFRALTQAQAAAGARSATRGRTVAQALALVRSAALSASALLAQGQARARSGALSRLRGVGQGQAVAGAQSAAHGRTVAQAQFTALVRAGPIFSRAQGQLPGRLMGLRTLHAGAQDQDLTALSARPLTRRFAVAQDQAIGGARQAITHHTAQGQAALLSITFDVVTFAYGQLQGHPSLRRTITRRRSLTAPQSTHTSSARITTARRLTASMALRVEAHLGTRRVVQEPSPVQVTMDVGASVNATQRESVRLIFPLVRGGTLTVRLSSPRTVSSVRPATGLATGVGDRELTTTLGS